MGSPSGVHGVRHLPLQGSAHPCKVSLAVGMDSAPSLHPQWVESEYTKFTCFFQIISQTTFRKSPAHNPPNVKGGVSAISANKIETNLTPLRSVPLVSSQSMSSVCAELPWSCPFHRCPTSQSALACCVRLASAFRSEQSQQLLGI
jgi:hypothetical protein